MAKREIVIKRSIDYSTLIKHVRKMFKDLKRSIHSCLSFSGKDIEDNLRKEHILASPEEIKKVISYLLEKGAIYVLPADDLEYEDRNPDISLYRST